MYELIGNKHSTVPPYMLSGAEDTVQENDLLRETM